MAIELVVRSGVDSAFLAWRAPFIKNCRGFALTRRVERTPGSTPSPETIKKGDDGFAVELVSSWVGFADGPQVEAGHAQTDDRMADPEIPLVGFHGRPGRPGFLSGLARWWATPTR